MVSRGLVREMRVSGGRMIEVSRGGPRSTLHATRSPQTAYLWAHTPSEIISPTLLVLAESYPRGQKDQILIDLARVLQLSDDVIADMRRLIKM
jgi:hypothetical protein